jgi:hypothetical protein
LHGVAQSNAKTIHSEANKAVTSLHNQLSQSASREAALSKKNSALEQRVVSPQNEKRELKNKGWMESKMEVKAAPTRESVRWRNGKQSRLVETANLQRSF